MLVVVVCLLALLSPLVVGRWPAGLLLRRWRLPALVWATLVIQAVVLEVDLPGAVAPVLHVATYASALIFLLANRSAPGLLVVAAGAASNGLTIALNSGTLPVSAAAQEAAGHSATRTDFGNTAVLADPVLHPRHGKIVHVGDIFTARVFQVVDDSVRAQANSGGIHDDAGLAPDVGDPAVDIDGRGDSRGGVTCGLLWGGWSAGELPGRVH